MWRSANAVISGLVVASSGVAVAVMASFPFCFSAAHERRNTVDAATDAIDVSLHDPACLGAV